MFFHNLKQQIADQTHVSLMAKILLTLNNHFLIIQYGTQFNNTFKLQNCEMCMY